MSAKLSREWQRLSVRYRCDPISFSETQTSGRVGNREVRVLLVIESRRIRRSKRWPRSLRSESLPFPKERSLA